MPVCCFGLKEQQTYTLKDTHTNFQLNIIVILLTWALETELTMSSERVAMTPHTCAAFGSSPGYTDAASMMNHQPAKNWNCIEKFLPSLVYLYLMLHLALIRYTFFNKRNFSVTKLTVKMPSTIIRHKLDIHTNKLEYTCCVKRRYSLRFSILLLDYVDIHV